MAYIQIFWQFPYLLPAIKNPHVIGLELTNNCNFDCIHCFRTKMNKDLGYMDVNLFKKLVDEISTYSFAFLRIVGRGEPALHPELKQIMEYIKGKQINIEFVTNGTIFEEYSNTEILSWNIDLLDISVDGTDKESYNRIRKNGDYDSLRNNIANFYHTRNSFKKKHPENSYSKCFISQCRTVSN
ncbi:GTP 3',8-cyclase [subsurface metagenome]